MGSTNQADSSGFKFRIAWKSMEGPSFLWNCSLSLLRGLRSLKNWLLKKIKYSSYSSLKNIYFGALIFQELEFFEHLQCNFKISWPRKISIFKKHCTAKFTLISMIEKMPLTFLMLKSEILLIYFTFVLLRPWSNARKQFQRKGGRSIDFHAILN